MKGHKLWILVLSIAAIAVGVIMAALDLYNSWSEHAMTPESPLLNFTLLCILTMYFIRSFSFKHMDKNLIWKLDVRNSNRLTAALFAGVLIFQVTHPLKWIENLHLIFTGAAMASAYMETVFYYDKRNVARYGAILGLVIGVMGFMGAFVFDLYSVATGEVIAAVPILLFILSNNK